MRLGPGLLRRAMVLALVATPALTGCGLFDRGSTLDDAFEYLPADTFSVRFTEGGIAPDLDTSELARYAQVMEDAPFNGNDVEWEAWASWGDPGDPNGTATVWKVDDDTDLEAFAEDLEEHGYGKDTIDGRSLFSIELSASEDGTIGGAYPVPLLLNVLIDEDEQLVVGAVSPEPLDDIAAVIADDEDSLADDGAMEDLVEAADGDPEVALLESGGAGVCLNTGAPLPEELQAAYGDLGRPEARALFVSGDDDPPAQLVLQYDSDDAAKDDLEAREALIEDGKELRSQQSFDSLGDFSVERDGDLLIFDEDFDGGPHQAVVAEVSGGGPGSCFPRIAD